MIEIYKTTELKRIQLLAELTWYTTYSSILKSEQLHYMFDLMYSTSQLEANLLNGNQFHIIKEESTDLGFTEIILYPHYIKINKIYIIPEQQGKGLGNKMINNIEQIAASLNVSKITLNVNRYNKALHFYIKSGFSIIEEVDVEIGNGYLMEDYILEKII